ncbi:radical SAM/SPASM domain-containing protein [Dysgonomonas sp. Marseille-P4677]|uniref:radical SAM/SPASM domain-containing protein n=1 Tax=Dysgonomonas sp. Marseille-P4677 TaxID=2364790 RepID=UPI001911C7BA|nr:radical SAM protein [Dysgonomonas sp. Marseille-P4677]
MLVHGYTGAIDIASESLLSYLQSSKTLSSDEAPFSRETWDILVKRGYITQKSKEEEKQYIARMADALHRRNKLFNNFTIIPSYDCNFRCSYCIENIISEKGTGWSKKTFTKEMADKAFDAMTVINPHMEFKNKQILLYGGEPLLKENKEIVTYIVKKGYELGYKFKAITNGYEIEHFQDLLSSDMLYTLQITIDGNKFWHDQRRYHYSDGGTFDRIIKNVGIALEHGVGVGIRINTDKNNLESINELKQLFENLGYYNYKNLFSVHVGWLQDTEQESQKVDKNNNIQFFSFKELNIELKSRDIEVSDPSNNLFNNLYHAISRKTHITLNPTGCSAQSGAYVFGPEGYIYNCLEVVGRKEYILGDFSENHTINWDDENKNRWHSTHIATIPKCSNCKYALLCHGGCPLKTIENKINLTSCESFPILFNMAANKAYNSYLEEQANQKH